jgi:peptidoglycan/LPS O-acetylase OafA/YrhL
MSATTASPPQRFAYIDSLRAFAAVLVLIFHCLIRIRGPWASWQKDLIEQGARGVQLFYVISAFTIFYTLYARKDSDGNGLRNFFIRRFFRIAPLFYCAIFFYLWLYGFGKRWALGDQTHITVGNIISNFFFVNGFSPYWINSIVPVGWSVTVEVTFYCCIPILFAWIKNLHQALVFMCLALLVCLGVGYFLDTHVLIPDPRLWSEFRFQWFFNQLPVFSLGIVLFFLLNPTLKSDQTNKRKALFWLIPGSLLALIGLAFVHVPIIPGHFLYAVAFVALTYGLAFFPSKIVVNPVTAYIGKISYSLYLTHVVAIRMATYLLHKPHWALQLLTVMVIAVLISSLTYYLIERPGQKLGSLLITALNRKHSYFAHLP